MQKKSYLTNNYAPLDISFAKGAGCYLFDKNNDKYLDALSGVGVCSLGHSHPKIVEVIKNQAENLLHTSNWYHIENQEILAEKLCKLAGMQNAFFGNSGAESNEAAIKATRLFASKKDIKNPIIITVNKSFHGRTMATLSATGNAKVQNGFAPLVPDFIHIDFDDISQIENLSDNENIVAIMLEPILGESGVIIPKDDYLKNVRTICDKNDWLMICDEVQTGIGRTGKMFAFEYAGITPDILTLAKGLGGGVPIGATLFNEKTKDLLTAGTHGSTFGGNPLVSRVALEVLNIIENDKILENTLKVSEYLQKSIKNIKSNKIKEVRIKGLMIGIETFENPIKLLNAALDDKLLINITGNTIRMLPPLILSKDEVDIIIEKLTKLLNNL
jgi:acetylornithine/N-succinyldiaminopimelate aminotransferase